MIDFRILKRKLKKFRIVGKKGASMAGWTEAILFSVLFAILLTGVLVNLNSIYGTSHSLPGLDTDTIQDSFTSHQDTVEGQVESGEAVFTESQGLTLKSSWGIIKATGSIIWSFITGGWIETVMTEYMKLPQEVATIFRILYFLSIGFIILHLLFKVKP